MAPLWRYFWWTQIMTNWFPHGHSYEGEPHKDSFEQGHTLASSIRVSRSHHVGDHPLFDCKNYSKDNTHGECVRKEPKQIFGEKLNCTPPDLVRGADEIWKERFNRTKKESEEIFLNFPSTLCRSRRSHLSVFLNVYRFAGMSSSFPFVGSYSSGITASNGINM